MSNNRIAGGDVVASIEQAFDECGHLHYGEGVSMAEHMLQTAHLAEQAGESDEVVVAALLHDFGHLICNMPNNTFESGNDNFHETIGADALAQWFDDRIVEPVRLHVDAKRFLCGSDPAYMDELSEASKLTLEVQGGSMNVVEISRFRENRFHHVAVRIRRYDDRGKQQRMQRPELSVYAPKIRACLK